MSTIQLKERPILFSGAMVRALLAGTKTQTRRAVKFPLKVPGVECAVNDCELAPPAAWCPYGQPGDRLWVRETCRAEEAPHGIDGVRYVADDSWHSIANGEDAVLQWLNLYYYRKQRGATVPPIHMPRWASRLLLEITAVRCERVQDISEADAVAEGVDMRQPAYYELGALHMIGDHNRGVEAFAKVTGARAQFAFLINSVNRRPGPKEQGVWEANPWVWVVEFKVIAGKEVAPC